MNTTNASLLDGGNPGERASGVQGARLALIMTIFILTTSCVAPKRANLIVPRRCLKVDAASFTRPCNQREDGKIVCDGVVVTATCLQVR